MMICWLYDIVDEMIDDDDSDDYDDDDSDDYDDDDD